MPDPYYKQLFDECFTNNIKLGLNIDLRNYATLQKLEQRRKRRYIIYETGFYIKNDMKYRLYLLMRLARKWITVGAVYQCKPPWYKPRECIRD